MLEADAGGTAVQVEPSRQQLVSFIAVRQIAAEEQSGKFASDMEVRTKQICVMEFLHAEKLRPLTFIMLAEHLQRQNSGEHSETVGGVF
jgi:hypothetical protein